MTLKEFLVWVFTNDIPLDAELAEKGTNWRGEWFDQVIDSPEYDPDQNRLYIEY